MRVFSPLVALLCAGLAGCAYQAEPLGIPVHNVVTSYSNKLPGKYLLFVDATALTADVRPNQMQCAAHSFPIAATDGFRGSIRQTLANIVDQIEEVPVPVPADQLRGRGARGLIVVRGDQIDGSIRVLPGFWSATMETEVNITASITVDGPGGRLLGTTVDGRGKGTAPAGFACEGGSAAMKDSAEKAMKEAVRRIAEALGNSERVRSGRSN